MTIEKLPSGSYRIRQQYHGKRYTVTVDHKPTQKEAVQLMAERFSFGTTKVANCTFEKACEQYLDVKSSVLSPSTISSYLSYLRNMPEWIKGMRVNDVDAMTVQKLVNEYASSHSAKYTKNIYGFVSAVLALVCPHTRIYATLPKSAPKKAYIPNDEDVKKVIDASRGTKYEIPIALACFGLRRSEICAITDKDLNGNILSINKAFVEDRKNKTWIIKPTTKTDASTRQIAIPQDIADMIREQGYAFNQCPNDISDWLYSAERKNGIPKFAVHKLRHYFCSKLNSMGIDEATILKMGGWSGSSDVMKRIYRHSMMTEEEQKKEVSDKLAQHLFL